MSLEKQEPNQEFLEELIKAETEIKFSYPDGTYAFC
jgi:hypothetical protein